MEEQAEEDVLSRLGWLSENSSSKILGWDGIMEAESGNCSIVEGSRRITGSRERRGRSSIKW